MPDLSLTKENESGDCGILKESKMNLKSLTCEVEDISVFNGFGTKLEKGTVEKEIKNDNKNGEKLFNTNCENRIKGIAEYAADCENKNVNSMNCENVVDNMNGWKCSQAQESKEKFLTIPCIVVEEALIKSAEDEGLTVGYKRKRKYAGNSYAINSWFYQYSEKEKQFRYSKKIKPNAYIDRLLLTCYRKHAYKGRKSLRMYEVEYIKNMKIYEGKRYYLIKWVGWPEEANTWECYTSLSCQQLISEFHEDFNRQLDKFMKKCHWDTFMKQQLTLCKKGLKMGVFERIFRSLPPEFSYSSTYGTKKHEQRQAMKLWQEKINEISKGKPFIAVENEVDLQLPPDGFTYIMNNVEGEGVTIPKEPLLGCECKDCSVINGCMCSCLMTSRLNYEKNGELKVKPGKPIYECNSRCSCGPECSNRVVQKGSCIPLSIFRTANDKGWGVKALQPIPKGTFVMEYVGEVITNTEAEHRGASYDADGITYLFDLDYCETENPLTIDAAKFGNISHFVNHSCAPNLQVYNVFVEHWDLSLPRIALFSKRNIAINEELTFDYQMTGATEDIEGTINSDEKPLLPSDDKKVEENGIAKTIASSDDNTVSNISSNQKIPCFCEARNCRGWLLNS